METSLFLGVSGWLIIAGFFVSLCVSMVTSSRTPPPKKDTE